MKQLIILLTLALFVANCASCNKTKTMDKNTITKAFKKRIDESGQLAPETVLLKATVLESNNSTLLMKVTKVLSYGHSTPNVAKGEKLHVKIKEKEFKEQLKPNNTVEVLLRSIHSMQSEIPEGFAEWEVIYIN